MTHSQFPLQGEVLAEVVRSGMVESIHAGHLVILDTAGNIELAKGSIELPIYGRSTLKALQAAAMLKTGVQFSSEELALVCASHSGSEVHQRIALEILMSVGLTENALRNTPDKPLGEMERKSWGEPTSLAQNCSGKHAGMLATCVHNNWDVETYLSPEHPLQVAIKKEIELLTGESVSHVGIDGCGAPLFAISTIGLAKAFHQMTISTDPIYQQIRAACIAHPLLVAGENRLTTRLMQAIPGLYMKEGAEAVNVATLADGRTVAFKIMDGSYRPFGPIMHSILTRWGLSEPDESVAILGGGLPVGEIRALL